MLSNLFGKDNDMCMILILFFLLCGGCGGEGGGFNFGDDNMLIWIVILFCLCGDQRRI